jgi:hypothetical protein
LYAGQPRYEAGWFPAQFAHFIWFCVEAGRLALLTIGHAFVLWPCPHFTQTGALKQLAEEWPKDWQLKHCEMATLVYGSTRTRRWHTVASLVKASLSEALTETSITCVGTLGVILLLVSRVTERIGIPRLVRSSCMSSRVMSKGTNLITYFTGRSWARLYV